MPNYALLKNDYHFFAADPIRALFKACKDGKNDTVIRLLNEKEEERKEKKVRCHINGTFDHCFEKATNDSHLGPFKFLIFTNQLVPFDFRIQNKLSTDKWTANYRETRTHVNARTDTKEKREHPPASNYRHE